MSNHNTDIKSIIHLKDHDMFSYNDTHSKSKRLNVTDWDRLLAEWARLLRVSHVLFAIPFVCPCQPYTCTRNSAGLHHDATCFTQNTDCLVWLRTSTNQGRTNAASACLEIGWTTSTWRAFSANADRPLRLWLSFDSSRGRQTSVPTTEMSISSKRCSLPPTSSSVMLTWCLPGTVCPVREEHNQN